MHPVCKSFLNHHSCPQHCLNRPTYPPITSSQQPNSIITFIPIQAPHYFPITSPRSPTPLPSSLRLLTRPPLPSFSTTTRSNHLHSATHHLLPAYAPPTSTSEQPSSGTACYLVSKLHMQLLSILLALLSSLLLGSDGLLQGLFVSVSLLLQFL